MKLDARFESDFKDNYKELKVAFERLKILKVCSAAYVAMQSRDSDMRALKPISAQALSVVKALEFYLVSSCSSWTGSDLCRPRLRMHQSSPGYTIATKVRPA